MKCKGSYAKCWEKSISERTCKCRGPVVGMSLTYLKGCQEGKRLSVVAEMKGLKVESIRSSHCGPYGEALIRMLEKQEWGTHRNEECQECKTTGHLNGRLALAVSSNAPCHF